jgi:RNA polymerase-binding transcription factor DksA
MKMQPGNWHICDWCGEKLSEDDFHHLGILDMCKGCAVEHAGIHISSIDKRLREAEGAMDWAARSRVASRLAETEKALKHYCADCGEKIEEPLCPACRCGVWYPFPYTSPEPGTRVLVYTAANNVYLAWIFEGAWHVPLGRNTLEGHGEVVTHWQRRPSSPRQAEPFTMVYSGFTTGSPVNISARDGPVFQIHAEDGEEVQRLVEYLNEQYKEDTDEGH